jgi:hypothetical protein
VLTWLSDQLEHVVHPSGGLVYHFRAFQNSVTRWEPFRRQVESWLNEWNPPGDHLLLIAPSGGYTLPLPWFSRFKIITALELDPIARRIFSYRLKQTLGENAPQIEWVTEDFLSPSQPERLRTLSNKFSKVPVLWSNVLGQLHLDLPEEQTFPSQDWHRAFQEFIQNRSAASYHDRLSGQTQAWDLAALHAVEKSSAPKSNKELAQFLTISCVLTDHETELFSKDFGLRQYSAWQISPEQSQLIEFCWKN